MSLNSSKLEVNALIFVVYCSWIMIWDPEKKEHCGIRKHPEESGIMAPMGNSSMCTQQVRQPSKRRLGRRFRRPTNIATTFLLLLLALLSSCCYCQDNNNSSSSSSDDYSTITDVYSNLTFTRGRYNASIYENNIGKSYVTPEER